MKLPQHILKILPIHTNITVQNLTLFHANKSKKKITISRPKKKKCDFFRGLEIRKYFEKEKEHTLRIGMFSKVTTKLA